MAEHFGRADGGLIPSKAQIAANALLTISGRLPLAASTLALFSGRQINERLSDFVSWVHQTPADPVDGRLGDADSRANGLLGHSSTTETLDGD